MKTRYNYETKQYKTINWSIISFFARLLSAKKFRVIALNDIPEFKELEMFDFQTNDCQNLLARSTHPPSLKYPQTIPLNSTKNTLDGTEVSPVLSMNFYGQSNDTLILLRSDSNEEELET